MVDMQANLTKIFESNNKNTISTTRLNNGEPLGIQRINFS